MRFSRSPVARTEDLVADDPLPVHHEGHRKTPSAIDQSHAIVGIMKDGKGQAILLLKRPRHRHTLRIGGYSENLKVLPRKCLVERFHRRHLYPTGAAPGGPKIHHHHFATQVRECHETSLHISELEVRRRLTQLDTVAPSNRQNICCRLAPPAPIIVAIRQSTVPAIQAFIIPSLTPQSYSFISAPLGVP